MGTYKFRRKPKDLDSEFREIEDNFAIKTDVEDKKPKLKEIKKYAPKLSEMSDGDEQIYYDGTDYFLYLRVGGKRFKVTLTED